jgi:hypothetical protein
MKKSLSLVIVMMLIASVSVFGKGGQEEESYGSTGNEFWDSIPEGQENISLDLYVHNTQSFKNTEVIATIRGNELTFNVPFESNQFGYFMPYSLNDIPNKPNSRYEFALVEWADNGYYGSDWNWIYVNKAGRATVAIYSWKLPEEGWYAIAKKQFFKLEAPEYKPPEGCYWVVIDRQTKEVVWWKN